MTEPKTLCVRCLRPTADAELCAACVDVWRDALDQVKLLLPELQTTIMRADNVTRGTRHHTATVEDDVAEAAERLLPAQLRSKHGRITLAPHALPVNLDAVNLQTEARHALRAQALALNVTDTPVRSYGQPLTGPACTPYAESTERDWTGRAKPVICGHESCIRIRAQHLPAETVVVTLAAHTEQLRQHPDAALLVNQAVGLARDLERAVDSSDPDVYVGKCDAPDIKTDIDEDGVIRIGVNTGGICGVDMYAHLGDRFVTCQACGYTYPVAARKQWLLEAVRDVWARPSLIASALGGLNIELTAAKLNHWISRDRAEKESGRVRRVAYPPILQVATDYQDENGDDVLDDDGKPIGRPLYRIGDVLDRVEALQRLAAARTTETRTA